MKVICSKTSIEFTASGFATLPVTSGEHPLFSAPFSTLLSLTESWRKRELSEGESRVLFVALLSSTGKVRWNTAATPPPEVVEKYMDYMIYTTNWKNAVGERLSLPEFHITHSTREMKDVGTWLSVWNNKQKEEVSASYTLRVREDIAKAQERLKKLLIAGREGDSLFLRHLYKWFVVATGVPSGIRDYWEQLFLLERPAIWGASVTDLDEMKEWVEDKLFSNGAATQSMDSYSMQCYRHVVKQWRDCKEGVLGALGEGVSPYTIISNSPTREVTNGVSGPETSEIVSLSKIDEPLLSNFSSSVDFIRARARWKLAKMHQEEKLRSEGTEHGTPIDDELGTELNNDNSKLGVSQL